MRVRIPHTFPVYQLVKLTANRVCLTLPPRVSDVLRVKAGPVGASHPEERQSGGLPALHTYLQMFPHSLLTGNVLCPEGPREASHPSCPCYRSYHSEHGVPAQPCWKVTAKPAPVSPCLKSHLFSCKTTDVSWGYREVVHLKCRPWDFK